MRRPGGTLLALAVLFGGLTAGGGVVIGAAPANAAAAITAYDISGHRLPTDPDVRSRQLIRLVGTGFPANTAIMVYRPKETAPAVVRSGRGGSFVYLYYVVSGLPNGQYSVVFAARGPTTPSTPISAPPTAPSATRESQPIELSVPVVVVWPFLLDDPGHPSPTPTPTPTPSPTATTSVLGTIAGGGQGTGGLSFTGVDIVGLVFVSLCAIGLGALVWREGARRRLRGDHTRG